MFNNQTTENTKFIFDNIMSLPSSVQMKLAGEARHMLSDAFGGHPIRVDKYTYGLSKISDITFENIDNGGIADLQRDYALVRRIVSNILYDATKTSQPDFYSNLKSLSRDILNILHTPTYDIPSVKEFFNMIDVLFNRYDRRIEETVLQKLASWVLNNLIPFKMIGLRAYSRYNKIYSVSNFTIDSYITDEAVLLELLTKPLYELFVKAKQTGEYDVLASLFAFILNHIGWEENKSNIYFLITSFMRNSQQSIDLDTRIDVMRKDISQNGMMNVMDIFSKDPLLNNILDKMVPDNDSLRHNESSEIAFISIDDIQKIDRSILYEAKHISELTIERYLPDKSKGQILFNMDNNIIGELSDLKMLYAILYGKNKDNNKIIIKVNNIHYVVFRYDGDSSNTLYGLSCDVAKDGTRKMIQIEYDSMNQYELQSPLWIR